MAKKMHHLNIGDNNFEVVDAKTRNDLAAEAAARSAAISDEAAARSAADSVLNARIDTLVTGTNITNLETVLYNDTPSSNTIQLSGDPADYDYIDFSCELFNKQIVTFTSADFDDDHKMSIVFPVSQLSTPSMLAVYYLAFSKSISGAYAYNIDAKTWTWSGQASDASLQRNISFSDLGAIKIVGRKIVNNLEVQDVRTGYDGTVYASAGEAVRGQIGDLNNDLDELDRIHVTESEDRYFNVLESGYLVSSGDGYYSTLQNVIHFNASDSFAYFVIELMPDTDYIIDPRARFLQTTMANSINVIQSIENTNYTSFNSGSAERAYISVSKTLLPIKVSTLCYSLDGLYYNSEKYIPKQKCKSAVASSMGTTDSLYIADALTNLRKGTRTVFTCDITSFSEIEVGLSKADTLGTNRSSRVNVDGTNIVYKTSSLHDPVTVAHGLTIENNLSLIIEKFGGRTAKITLTSNGQMFSINDAVWVADKTGAPYMSSIGSILTNCKLSWTCTDIDKDIWIFGDSYVQANDNRWAYYLEEFGYNKNVLIDGFGGESSSYATASLHNLIKMASPKMIIWCLGMNDGGDSGAPNTSWKSAVDDVIQVCTNNDIEFIPATIPTVPNINNEYKDAWIRSSGYRYIDFAEAVGAQSDGTWFSGMLASDNVHPTIAGAKALFNRVLVDCPNVMIDQ